MKKLMTSTAVFSLCMVGAANAEMKQYISGKLAVGLPTVNIEVPGGYSVDVDFDAAFGLNAAYGVKVSDFRIEIEANLNTAAAAETDDADLYNTSAMLNGYYDLALNDKFTVYGGLGLGYNRAVLAADGLDDFVGGGLAWQVGLGVAYNLDESWTLDLGYRYFDGGSINEGYSDLDVSYSEFKAGVRYFF